MKPAKHAKTAIDHIIHYRVFLNCIGLIVKMICQTVYYIIKNESRQKLLAVLMT